MLTSVGDGAVAESGGVRLVADARIDNLSEIRSLVGVPSDADSAHVLIAAYRRWGAMFPQHLSGDFSFLLWDGDGGTLIAGRDPFGARALAYRVESGSLRLATRVSELVAVTEERAVINDQAVVEYLLWRFGAPAETFFRSVSQVPPGHVLLFRGGQIQIRRYWYPPPATEKPAMTTRQEYLDEFKRLFIRAVERRLLLRGTTLVHVSGGLDSSSIACAADALVGDGRITASEVRGISATYPGMSCDESPFIEAIARQVRFTVRRWDARTPEPLDLVEPSIEAPGGRVRQIGGSRGGLEIARELKARVILSGLGGDQLTSSSGIVRDLLAAGRWRAAFRALWSVPGTGASHRIARMSYVVGSALPPGIRNISRRSRAVVPDWLQPEWKVLAQDLATEPSSEFEFVSHVQRERWSSVMSQQVMRSVEGSEREASEFDCEYRFPFLDTDLVRFVLMIPYENWPAPESSARLHRDALTTLLPDAVRERRQKAEFTPALANRAVRAASIIDDLFDRGPWRSERYVDRGSARRLWRGAAANPDQTAAGTWRQVWAIVTLEAWMRAFSGLCCGA